MISGFY